MKKCKGNVNDNLMYEIKESNEKNESNEPDSIVESYELDKESEEDSEYENN